MKYFEQMNKLEEQIIRLDTVESMLRILGDSEPSNKDMLHIVWHISDIIKDLNENLSDNFYNLWSEIREDEDVTHLDGLKDYLSHRRFDKIISQFIPKEEVEVNTTGC